MSASAGGPVTDPSVRPVRRAPWARPSGSAALDAAQVDELDVVVIGGGVVGAGVALDAVTRGLTVGLVEGRDWAAGTS